MRKTNKRPRYQVLVIGGQTCIADRKLFTLASIESDHVVRCKSLDDLNDFLKVIEIGSTATRPTA